VRRSTRPFGLIQALMRISDTGRIIAFRNRLIHTYASIADDVVRGVLETNLPTLEREVEALLREVGGSKEFKRFGHKRTGTFPSTVGAVILKVMSDAKRSNGSPRFETPRGGFSRPSINITSPPSGFMKYYCTMQGAFDG
jgi:hypothetical protein